MAVGEYVVYERASKDEEQLFLKIAIEEVGIVKEPSNWMKPRNTKPFLTASAWTSCVSISLFP